ncbi:lactate utilization protein [candidate division KSB1 bacterium]|nr:lactate utilization protein [candidate division KSB1 bacterium]
MLLRPSKTKKYISRALRHPELREAVRKATDSSMETRRKIISQIPHWEDFRTQAHALKNDILNHLDVYLQEFEKNCQRKNIQVHWANDSAEANQIVLDLIEKNQVKNIVKSKSLTSEETNLNHFLEAYGYAPLETDLGEYIIQLNEETPSHLIIPALHLRRQDIGKLFQRKLGVDYTDDPPSLLKIARTRLREKFLAADMGISGVNFAVANPGVICVVENEANAHLTTHLPKIHVALMGLEKVIPDFAALSVFLKLLGPSATSQKASTYVNLISEPTFAKCGEGPEQVHVIILDNGRSQILKDPHLRETLFCIRCGSCLNHCPVYQQIGGHAYGWIYMGPIGITLIPQYLGAAEGRYAPFLCSLCGECYQVCPIQINLPHHLLKLRNRVAEAKQSLWIERWGIAVWAFLAKRPRLYRLATWFPGKFQMLLPKKMSFPVPGYTKERALARFDAKGFRNRFYQWQKASPKQEALKNE